MVDAEERVEVDRVEGDDNYISVVQAIKLIPVIFNGNPKELRSFIEGVEAAHEVVHPRKHALLLKFIESKITGEAKDKLLARGDRQNWENVRAILEENYSVKRTLEYYAGVLFQARQGQSESVAQWAARIDSLAVELRRETRARMERLQIREGGQNYSDGAMKLIFELVKGTFVAGLRDERIRYVVKTKGEEESLAQIVETALQEECEVRSLHYKHNAGSSQWTSNRDRNTRPSNFPTQHIKREVNVAISSPTERNQCYRCLGTGHIARECRNTPQCNKCKKRGHDTRS